MSNSKKILLFAPFGSFTVHHQLDAVLSAAMRLRGYDAFAVLCDGIYSVCDVLAWSADRACADCANCARSGRALFEAFALRTLQMRGFFTAEELLEIERWADSIDPLDYQRATWREAPIGEWVISSVCSYFRITSHQLNEPKVRAIHKRFLINGALTYTAINRIIKSERPSHAVVFNGRFSPYRIALESCRRQGIPVITHERGWAQDTFVTYSNAMAIETAPIHECGEAWRDIPLLDSEVSRVRSYFINREKGLDINVTPFLTFQTEHSRVRAQLRIPPETPIVTFFTTGEYELEFCDDFKTDISQLDFIRILIDIFRGRPEALVIRHHPYIAGDEVSPPDKHFLGEAARLALQSPENVRVIMPGERLSSYALMWNTEGAIAPFSTTGVESVARGVKAYGLKQSPFRLGLCGVFTDLTKSGVEATLNEVLNPQNPLNVDDLRRLYRFQSSFISRLCTIFRSFGIKDTHLSDIKITKIDQLKPDYDPALDRLCDHIEKGTPLFELPPPDRSAEDPSEESSLLQTELERIRDKRLEVKAQAREYFEGYTRPKVLLIREISADSDSDAWNTSLHRSRHQVLDYRKARFDDLRALLSIVSQASAPIAALAPSQVLWIDEAFLSRGCEELLEDQKLNAVISGQWYLNELGRLSHGLFTRHYHSLDSLAIKRSLGEQGNWLSILQSGVFRRDALIELISSILTTPSDEAATTVSLNFLKRGDVKLTKEGLIYCSSITPN